MNLLRRFMCHRSSQRREAITLTKVLKTIAILLVTRELRAKSTILKGSPNLNKILMIPFQHPSTAFHITSRKLLRRRRAKVGVKTKLRLLMRTRVADKQPSKVRPLREIVERRWERRSLKWSRSYLSSVHRLTFEPLAKQTSAARRASHSTCIPPL